jgi:protein-tyrosine-phosphatase
MYSVLFICTANICRSPMAEGLMKALVKDSQDTWRIGSAGTWTVEGEPAAVISNEIMNERGIDLSAHRSRIVTPNMMKEYQLVLTMEHGHKEALSIEFKAINPRIFLLSEMIGKKFDIPDPMGRARTEYKVIADEIATLIEQGQEKIKNLAYSEE